MVLFKLLIKTVYHSFMRRFKLSEDGRLFDAARLRMPLLACCLRILLLFLVFISLFDFRIVYAASHDTSSTNALEQKELGKSVTRRSPVDCDPDTDCTKRKYMDSGFDPEEGPTSSSLP